MKYVLVTIAIFFCLTSVGAAQTLVPASPPIANPADIRFAANLEDWTTPALASSNLRAMPAMSSGVSDHGSYTLQMVRLQWRWADPIDVYISKPKGVAKPGVILYLYGHASEGDRFRSDGFQKSVTKDGFAAVGFVSALTGHRFHDRPFKQWFVSELQESLAVSAHDVQMLLNYLATRDDLDMDRVGMFAQDSGASIAILASSVDPRIKVLDVVDPWGDWPDWLAASPIVPESERAEYLKPEFLKKVATLDPVVTLPLVQAKKFRLQDATFAPSTPKVAKEKMRAAVTGVPGRATIVVYKTPEETKSVLGGNAVLEWIERELRAFGPPEPEGKLAQQDRPQAP